MQLASKATRIYVAGHRGLVGSSITRALAQRGYTHLITRTRAELDLRDRAAVTRFFEDERPEVVVLAAAKVGGILANDTYPVDFLVDNLAIELNVLQAAHTVGVRRLLFLGSSCIYPKHAPQPLKEEALLTGPLEPTNEWYAVAKIAGLKMCQAYRKQYGADFFSVMPTNLYGEADNFDLQTSHVLPALLRKFHEAKRDAAEPDAPVTVWGSGTPRREFLHSDDLADACCFLLEQPSERLFAVAPDGLFNVGVGQDLEIRELAALIRSIVGSTSEIQFDRSKPDGTPRKLMDISRLTTLGWSATIPLDEGIRRVYAAYRAAQVSV